MLDRLHGNLSTCAVLGEEWNSRVVRSQCCPSQGVTVWEGQMIYWSQMPAAVAEWLRLEGVSGDCSEQGQLEEIALGPFPIEYGIYSWKERFHTYSGKSFQSPLQEGRGFVFRSCAMYFSLCPNDPIISNCVLLLSGWVGYLGWPCNWLFRTWRAAGTCQRNTNTAMSSCGMDACS